MVLDDNDRRFPVIVPVALVSGAVRRCSSYTSIAFGDTSGLSVDRFHNVLRFSGYGEYTKPVHVPQRYDGCSSIRECYFLPKISSVTFEHSWTTRIRINAVKV